MNKLKKPAIFILFWMNILVFLATLPIVYREVFGKYSPTLPIVYNVAREYFRGIYTYHAIPEIIELFHAVIPANIDFYFTFFVTSLISNLVIQKKAYRLISLLMADFFFYFCIVHWVYYFE